MIQPPSLSISLRRLAFIRSGSITTSFEAVVELCSDSRIALALLALSMAASASRRLTTHQQPAGFEYKST